FLIALSNNEVSFSREITFLSEEVDSMVLPEVVVIILETFTGFSTLLGKDEVSSFNCAKLETLQVIRTPSKNSTIAYRFVLLPILTKYLKVATLPTYFSCVF